MDPQTIVLAQAALDFATEGEQRAQARRTEADLAEVSDRIAKAKSGLARSYVATISKGHYPDATYQRTARWLADLTTMVEVVKADGQGLRTDTYEQWAGRRVKRVGGRFASSTTPADVSRAQGGRAEQIKQRVAAEKLPPGLRYGNKGMEWEGGVPPSTDTRQRGEQWLGAQLTANELERELRQAFGPKTAKLIDLKVNIADPRDPSKFYVRDIDDYDGIGQAVSVGFDVDEDALREAPPEVQTQVKRRVAMLQGMGATGGMTDALMDEQSPLTQGVKGLGKPGTLRDNKRTAFSSAAQSAGRLMQGFSPTQGIGQTLEAVGQAAGSPAAEQLQPYVERAAARYTGTRVRPSQQIEEMFGDYSDSAARLEALRSMTNAAAAKKELAARWAASGKQVDRHDTTDVVGMNPVDAAAKSRMEAGQRKDQLVLGVQSDLAALALGQQLPDDPMLNVLSQKAGKTLPSRGVIIGADGEVAFEAVGQSDDHYTPFNAKMLGSLEGGQFVRTRQKGGPSVEDLRTMMSTGARMATVVSPSGVFELELAPEARGMKRFGPQMQSMNDAYRRLLDTIASNALADEGSSQYLGSLDPKTAQQIEAKVAGIADPERAKTERQRLRQKAYTDAASKSANINREELYQEKITEAASMSPEQRNQLTVNEWARQAADAEIRYRVRPLMLNGEGYDLALRTLQARFPHLIRTARYRDTQQFAREVGQPSAKAAGLPRSAGADSGYLSPGQVKTFGGTNPRQEQEAARAKAAGPTDADTTPKGEKSTSSAKTPEGKDVTRVQDKSPEDSMPVKVAQAAGQEARNVLRESGTEWATQLAALNAQTDGWKMVLGEQKTDVGDGKLPDSFDDAVAMKGESGRRLAPLYAAMRMQQGRTDELLEEFEENPRLLGDLLSNTTEDMQRLFTQKINDITAGQEPNGNAADVAANAAEAVTQLAHLHKITDPGFVPAPTDMKALATLPPDQAPLPSSLENMSSIDDYVAWANGNDEDAVLARQGRVLTLSNNEAFTGLRLLAGIQQSVAQIDKDLDDLAKDLKGKNGDGEAEGVVSKWRPDLQQRLIPEIREQLASTYEDDREGAIEKLRAAIRLGASTHLLQSALEVGDADPKGLGTFLAGLKPTMRGYRQPEPPFLLEAAKGKRVPVSKAMSGVPWQVLRRRVLSHA